jgi:hypothetical protein
MGRTCARRLGGLALALLLAVGLAVSPATTRVALAADPLGVQSDATYTLDPAAGRVHVVITWQVTDLKPNSAQFIYYYTGYQFAVQGEARSIKASDSGGALAIKTRAHASYIEATVNFRSFLYYRQTAKFTVRYDLVGGAPRSSSTIRVGKAFATFGVWAWGDPGEGSVVVRTPQGFGSTVVGDPMSKASSGGQERLRATPAEPDRFFAIVSAENPLAYTQDRLSFAGGVEIVIMAWPEDRAWDETISKTLRAAFPALRELIGLEWPVEHDLNVRERFTPALEGYAGVFFPGSQRIDVSEDLDPVVIVHETSHTWFNENLFVERWIYEGLAQEYAWRVQHSIGGEGGGLPAAPDPRDPGFVLLSAWTFPEVIRDQATDDRERYGYQASFWLVHRLVSTVGVDRMRNAFAAAAADVPAYPGAGAPEKVSATSGWKRFLDLVESFDPQESTDTERSLRDLVLTSASARELDDRSAARTAYRQLLDSGDGWLPGWYVRRPMGEWRFDVAEKRMTEAMAVLGLRTQVDEAAVALGLQPGDALKTAYENATDGLDGATSLAEAELDALAAIADAKAKVEAEPDLVSTIGLLGETPSAPYAAARDAFERGDIETARTSATAAAALITGAAAVGQGRLTLAVAITIALLALLALLSIAARRRRQRLVLALVAGPPSEPPSEPVSAPASPDAYATLAADPGAAPAPSDERPPDAEGGPARVDDA